MLIKRTLQYATWEFDTQTTTLRIIKLTKEEPEIMQIVFLNKTEMFSLCRFLIRCFQTIGRKKRKEVTKIATNFERATGKKR